MKGIIGRRTCLVTLVLAGSASALDGPTLGKRPIDLDLTDTSSVIYNADNRNSRPADVASQADDDWGMWYNRFNLQSNWQGWRLGVRVDSALFFASRSPSNIALELLRREHGGRLGDSFSSEDADFFVQKVDQAGQELSTRFINWVYPAKLALSYSHKNIEGTVGDFYAQFGRGLVLSARKRDELSSDTTIRGLRLTGKARAGESRLELTILGGTLNPLRIDEASGRVLGVTSSVSSGWATLTEAGMPRAIATDFAPLPRPNYAPDNIVGAQFELRQKGFGASAQGTRLSRRCLEGPLGCQTLSGDLARSAHTIDTGGIALDLPTLGGIGALYVEYAHQRLSDFNAAPVKTRSGNAVYASLNLALSPLSITLEGKHYRSFFPLSANIDVGGAREFLPVQYSLPPTTEPIWNDTQFEGFNTCTTGGRSKLDLELQRGSSVYVWVGRYNTWAESDAAGNCNVTDKNLNRVWDLAEGVELSFDHSRSKANFSLGTRFDTADRLLDDAHGRTHTYYRELYTRYDIVKWLGGGKALQFQGWHRRRRLTLGGPESPWLQGMTITSLQWSARLSLGLGLEYDQNPAFPDTYVNGQVRYNLDSSSNLSLFVGQRQGGLRCVSGVCRIFPPFEGARLDATLRF